MTTSTIVNTRKVEDRRTLRFETIDDAIADAEKVAAADQAGKAHTLGNWTLGQIFNHLATWADYAYTGAPMQAPWFVRIIAKTFKKRFLTKSMPAGGRIPRVPGGTYGTEDVPTSEALDHFRKAFSRLKAEAPTAPSPAFGPLTHDEAIALNLRHAELHLSFIQISA